MFVGHKSPADVVVDPKSKNLIVVFGVCVLGVCVCGTVCLVCVCVCVCVWASVAV